MFFTSDSRYMQPLQLKEASERINNTGVPQYQRNTGENCREEHTLSHLSNQSLHHTEVDQHANISRHLADKTRLKLFIKESKFTSVRVA